MSDTFTSLYLQDPATAIRMRQLQAAQRLRQEGSSSAPVQHWTQGLNRILQSAIGSMDERAALDAMRQDQQQQDRQASEVMQSLFGGRGSPQQLVAAANSALQQPAPQAMSPAPGEPQQPAPTVPPRANFTVPGGDIYGGRGGPQLAARDGALGAGPTQLAALSAGRASDIGQPLNNPAVTGPNSELPGWDAGLGAPTGRINPMVGGNPGGAVPAPTTGGMPSTADLARAALAAGNNRRLQSLIAMAMPHARQAEEDARRTRERTEDRGYRVEDRDIALAEARAARAAEAARFDRTFGLQERQLAATIANQGVPAGYRRTAAGGLEAIQGGPADPRREGAFGGTGVEAAALRVVTDPASDVGSPEYAVSYQRLYGPRQVQQPDGTIVIMTPQPPPGIRMPAGMQAPGAPPPPATSPQQQPPVAQVDPGSPTIAGPAPGMVASPPQMPGQQPTTTQTPAGAVTRIPGRGTPLSDGAINSLSEQGGILSQWRALGETFNPDFGGYGIGLVGRAANTIARNTAGASPRADWWQQFDSLDNVVRNQLFGSALTATEKAAWEATTVSPGSSPETIRANLARRQQIVRDAITRQARARLANGANPQAVSEATGIPLEVLMAPQAAPGTGGAAPSTSGWGIRPVER